ncbi:hypothetical protein C2G38_2068724, partial [Gigaspora rosea]
MDEIKIWNHIIDWGIAQNSNLESDPEDWSQEDFLTLKTSLKNCLPHIRYFQISGNDIIDKVYPYQQILDKNLWKDILKRVIDSNRPISSIILPLRAISDPSKILPPRGDSDPLPPHGDSDSNQTLPPNLISTPTGSIEPFSAIINQEHVAEIASWIDDVELPYSTMNIPYEFKLLLRGSRDGFAPTSFWNLCNKRINVLIVMKVDSTNEILGDCDDCFIFSLKNNEAQESILSRALTPERVIYCNSGYGPSFSSGLYMGRSGYDLNQPDRCC